MHYNAVNKLILNFTLYKHLLINIQMVILLYEYENNKDLNELQL